MKNVIEKKLTKRLEKFVSDVQNPIFASRFRDKIKTNYLVLGTHMGKGIKTIVLTYRRTYKFVYGKDRVKNFLLNNIGDFENDHQKIVRWIENGDVEQNKELYVECKNRISAVLKATRRLNSLKVTDNERITAYLNERINRKRFAKKYELAT